MGYVITFIVSLVNFGYIIRVLGYILMAYAFVKLRPYGKDFRYPMIISFVMIFRGIYDLISKGAVELAIELPLFFDAPDILMSWIDIVLVTALNIAMLYSIYSISKSVDLPKIQNSAIRNAVFVGLYFIINVLAIGPFRGNETYSNYFGLPMLLLQFAWIILNSVIIFSSYMRICPEEDVDMKRKKTGIGFVDKILDESDRRMEKAVNDTNQYIEDKQKSRLEKKNKKKK